MKSTITATRSRVWGSLISPNGEGKDQRSQVPKGAALKKVGIWPLFKNKVTAPLLREMVCLNFPIFFDSYL